MTLKDLIKTAEVKQQWMLGMPQQNQAAPQTQPAQPKPAQQVSQPQQAPVTQPKAAPAPQPKPEPKPQVDTGDEGFHWNPLKWQWGYQGEGSRWNPTNYFSMYNDSETKRLAAEKTSADPAVRQQQIERAKALGSVAQQGALEAAHDQAVAASWSPYFVPEVSDWLYGRSWQDSRDLSMLKQEYADELRNAGYNDDQIAERMNNLGYITDGDTFLGNAGRQIQDLGREVFARGLVVNLVGGPVLKGVGSVASKIPGVGVAGKAIGQAGTAIAAHMPKALTGAVGTVAAHTPGVIKGTIASGIPTAAVGMGLQGLTQLGEHTDGTLHDTFMMMGLNSNRMNEQRMKELYGTQGAFNNMYQLSRVMYDADGNPVKDDQGNILLNTSDNPADYQEYTQWAKAHGFEDMASPEAQKQYIQWYMGNGAIDSSIVYTPMFQNLSTDDQVGAMSTLLKNRVLFKNKSFTTMGQLGDSNASMLDYALQHDDDGSMHVILGDLLSGSSPEAFAQFIGQGANGAGGNQALDELYKTVGDGIMQRSMAHPEYVGEDINNMLKLKTAQGESGGNSKGAQAIAKAYENVFTDPSVIPNMTGEQALDLAESLIPLMGGDGSGMNALGPNGPEVISQLKSNIQGRMWDAVLSDPIKNLPRVISLWLSSKGMTGVADAVRNPWVFYGTAASLLGGGLLLTSSVFDSDDEDEEDEDADYYEALQTNPYA